MLLLERESRYHQSHRQMGLIVIVIVMMMVMVMVMVMEGMMEGMMDTYSHHDQQ